MTLVRLLDLIGIGVFAVSGALAAGRKRLDLLGVFVLASVTAIGGGTIRDLLLDRHPIFWLAEPQYIVVILVAAGATMLYVRMARVPGVVLEVADDLGLALIAVTGAQVAPRAGMAGIVCVLLGTVTGVAGGLIRDVLLAQVPQILRRGSLYATAAIVGVTFYLALVALGVGSPVATLAGMTCVAGVRLAAIWWELKLPAFEVHTADHQMPSAERRSRGAVGSAPPDDRTAR